MNVYLVTKTGVDNLLNKYICCPQIVRFLFCLQKCSNTSTAEKIKQASLNFQKKILQIGDTEAVDVCG